MAKLNFVYCFDCLLYFEWWFWLGIFCLGLIGMLNYVFWWDEVNGWLIGWDSVDFVDFWCNVCYEGYFLFWYGLFWLLN